MKLKKGPTAFDRAMDDAAVKGDASLMAKDFPRLIDVELAKVHRRADQPRRHFDEDALRQLADSIGRQGLLQPILVRALPDARGEYEIVAGERRWRAHKLLGKPTIHAIVTTGAPEEIALVENLQRVDLSPIEEARGIQALMDRHGYTQEAAAGALGWSRTQVNRVLKLLVLPEAVVEECATLHIPRNAMVELALAGSEEERASLLDVLRRGGSVKALREARAPKAAGQGRRATAPDELAAFFQGLDRMERAVATLADAGPALTDAQRARLRQLRDQLDRVLTGGRTGRGRS
ncbi:MAG TPA: ParB/RepB/Spo0J family partition protein [Azospirillaceae bacterium]|nr:ParB/RepB/Spo0J family partition protein [Azospirillaceae bacterium]